MSDYDNQYRTDDARDPDAIQHDIERTRAEMSSTIDAIQEKLTPGQMMDQAVAYARTSLPADFGQNLSNAVRNNPLPVALVGIGLAWLAMSGQQPQRRAYRASASEYYGNEAMGTYDADRYGEYDASTGHGMKERASEFGHRISSGASSVSGRARDAAHGARERMHDAREKLHGARERISESAHSARERMDELGHRSQEQYYRARDNVNHMIEEQPLMIGALGLAVGAVLGAMLPSTRREDEMMGQTRDELFNKAKQTAREQSEHLKESAQRVGEVAKQEARQNADEMSERAKQATGAAGTRQTGDPQGYGLH